MNLRKLLILLSNKHDLLYRVVLITVSVLVITAFLPRQSRFKYDFAQGERWMYDELVAPFDFPVYKSRREIETEKLQIASQSPLYFRKDTSATRKASVVFESLYRNADPERLKLGKEIISSFYTRGILEIPRNIHLPPEQQLWLISGNEAGPSDVSAHLLPGELAAQIEQQLIRRNKQSNGLMLSALVQALKPDLLYDAKLTEKSRAEAIASLSMVHGMVTKGAIIIDKGRTVGATEFLQLESLRKSYEDSGDKEHSPVWLYIGYLLLVCTAIAVLLTFLWLLRKDILLDSRKMSLLILLIVLTCVVYTLVLGSNRINMLLVPLCILPLVTRAFFDTRTALFTHVLTVLILGTVAPAGYDFIFMQVIAGMVAIFAIVNMRKRSQLFFAVGIIFAGYFVSYLGLSLLHEGHLLKVNYQNTFWIAGSCLLTLLSYPLIFFFEKVFGVTSDFTLMELTDFNSELLRELSLRAPGTFQHSLQVANLAESACYRIGGNSLLVRVGALYHDVGKMDMPMYFIENQSTQVNPHDELSYEESAGIIIAHVIRGIEKARKYKLPDVIIDFIRTHHGTMVVQYFYQSFIRNNPEEEADEDDFRYPGPKPFSKETAVLMMADSVEAAARSLAVHDENTIESLVDNIISHQIASGQFENCDITYRDITTIKKIFKKMLSSIYHVRIAYPT
jgi:putative nucleotidyltransferase with HDIG domain